MGIERLCNLLRKDWVLYLFLSIPGSRSSETRDMSLGEFAVRQVLISCFWYAGYLVAMDNWFMCMGVVQFCISVGVHVVGTLRTGRTGFPSKSLLTLPNSAGAVARYSNTVKVVFLPVSGKTTNLFV